jgi:hypothetical protein
MRENLCETLCDLCVTLCYSFKGASAPQTRRASALKIYMNLFIEILGWIGSVLVVGAYALNLRGTLSAKDPRYIWSNLIGGLFFVVNTLHHGAYPSALVNVVWVIIALVTLAQKPKNQ